MPLQILVDFLTPSKIIVDECLKQWDLKKHPLGLPVSVLGQRISPTSAVKKKYVGFLNEARRDGALYLVIVGTTVTRACMVRAQPPLSDALLCPPCSG